MKLIFRITLVIFVTIGVIKIDTIFLKHPIFEIKDIKIVGGSEKLIESFNPLKAELIGKNINDINLLDIKNRIARDVRIEAVNVQKESVNKISIELKEKVPKCYIQYRDNVYISDENGEIFGYFNDLKPKDFPFLVINPKIKNTEEQISTLLKILSEVERTDFKDVVSQLYIDDPSLIKMYLANGTEIRTNTAVLKEKYDIGSYLFFNLSYRKELSYIDLRYKDYIVKYMEDKNGR